MKPQKVRVIPHRYDPHEVIMRLTGGTRNKSFQTYFRFENEDTADAFIQALDKAAFGLFEGGLEYGEVKDGFEGCDACEYLGFRCDDHDTYECEDCGRTCDACEGGCCEPRMDEDEVPKCKVCLQPGHDVEPEDVAHRWTFRGICTRCGARRSKAEDLPCVPCPAGSRSE